MSITCTFATHGEAKTARWHSRRHATSAEHEAEHQRQVQRALDKDAGAIARKELRDEMSASEQLKRLDRILGKDAGAKRERARLIKIIERETKETPAKEQKREKKR